MPLQSLTRGEARRKKKEARGKKKEKRSKRKESRKKRKEKREKKKEKRVYFPEVLSDKLCKLKNNGVLKPHYFFV
ncbi:hypothetical protein [Flavobacterium sp.]|jgi:hypothetical protein|uniref:hypothetical protein n=1 Tax=Flavobacterium sp. TaxID=239 RepID=UPI0022BC3294|nr:hypothetical protein [Flavobacterium sp.]MCZ8168259.1 hypothetical protein [Flavobacterium sp.]MCZ8296911.1 hypothetical protein [Flavobacterium sp.]